MYWYRSPRGLVLFRGVEGNRLFEKERPFFLQLRKSFYGMSGKQAWSIGRVFGFSAKSSFSFFGDAQFRCLNILFLNRNWFFGYKLLNNERSGYKRLFKIKCRRGLRLLKGLPVRGQRTHTNANTCFDHAFVRKKLVFTDKDKLVGTRAERRRRYEAKVESEKAKRLHKSKMKVRALLREVKRKRKLKEKARAWIMSKQKAQMERARKKRQAIAAKKKQERYRQW